jgi:hypothetical protein
MGSKRPGRHPLRLAPAEIVDILKPVVPGMGRREVARSTRPQRASFGRLRPGLA